MIAAITAALATLYSTATADGEALVRRIHSATIALVTLDSQMVGRSVSSIVPDSLYCECKSLYMMFRHPHTAAAQPLQKLAPPLVSSAPSAGRTVLARHVAMNSAPARRYQTRKAITIAQAAAITGLSESTIKRLDKNPANTNYPGRNSTAAILAAWAKMHGRDKCAARGVRAANRPRLGYGRS